ncbi:MAG: SDR family oxidoreductase [Colwellia sp.]|nr:SDR family oxidoreductase [Colwellia sp.]
MTILVLGASGETGRLVVSQLLEQKRSVRVIVRSATKFYALFPADLIQEHRLSVKEGSVLELSEQELYEQVTDCSAVISCLGHNISFQGIYGKPRRLVTDSVKCICQAIKQNDDNNAPVKFVLMNSTGNLDIKAGEKISFAQKIVIGFIRYLAPPHADNEAAAKYLQTHYFESSEQVEWSVVRPDTLIDEVKCSEYDIYPSPIRSAIFDAGITSRINVAHLMTALVTDSSLWAQWKTKMPVIYNRVN